MPDTIKNTNSLSNLENIEIKLPFSQVPDRLDKVLSKLVPQYSRARLQEWIDSGNVLVNQQKVKIRYQAMPGDNIEIICKPSQEDLAYQAEDIKLNIIHQTNNWAIIDKPAGLVTHPGAGNWTGTLLNGLLHYFPHLNTIPRAGIVHRLDKDTSGILVVALNLETQTDLVRQLQARTVLREYRALVVGKLTEKGLVNKEIGRDRRVAVRMTTENPIAAKPALTYYSPLRSGFLNDKSITEVMCQLHTGRTHQIRVHMSCIGHPLLGDQLYGGPKLQGEYKQMLHAHTLGFVDIQSKQHVQFTSESPSEYQNLCDQVWGNSK